MKILLASHVFLPRLGGIELNSLMLAMEFAALGHTVRVVTQTKTEEEEVLPFEVIRRPSGKRMLALVGWCDVFFHNNISLQAAWPLLLIRRPWVVSHHTWIRRTDGSLSWQDHLKRQLLGYARCISNSHAIANDISVPSEVIAPSYRDYLFHTLPGVRRDKEMVFLARLVSDKGADILLEALAMLQKQGLTPRLTIIGDGPERKNLEQLAKNLQLADSVCFIGAQSGSDLVYSLNEHQIMVVPSRWAEPFGIVAVEGIACGCVIVGSEDGGLQDAIGPCGVTFPNGDTSALAQRLSEILMTPARMMDYRAHAAEHLARHTPEAVAQAHLKVFEAALR